MVEVVGERFARQPGDTGEHDVGPPLRGVPHRDQAGSGLGHELRAVREGDLELARKINNSLLQLKIQKMEISEFILRLTVLIK